MTQILCFQNAGEIDPRLVTIMGTNVKEGANPIGYFGTGLKIAIAIVLRLGGQITIQSGEKQMTFYASDETIRGKIFGLIRMETDGEIQFLGFTTELGKTWEPWMAYRELYCNMKDENGSVVLMDTMPSPCKGNTRVLVDCPELLAVHKEPRLWLLPKVELLWKTPVLECYAGKSYVGYYHGIRVCEFEKPTTFIYNLLGQHTLTEDRTLASWQFFGAVTREVIGKDRPSIPLPVLTRIATPNKAAAESDWYWPSYIQPREEILNLVQASPRERTEAIGITHNLREAVTPYLPKRPLTRSLFDDLDEAAPEIPPYTCPFIDDLQTALLSLANSLRLTPKTDVLGMNDALIAAADTIDDIVGTHLGSESDLERLRTINESLRLVGQFWRRQCKILAKDIPSSKRDAA
jgi:hypothetical protein